MRVQHERTLLSYRDEPIFYSHGVINYPCLLRTNVIMRKITSLFYNLADCFFIIADLCKEMPCIVKFKNRKINQDNIMDEDFFNDLYEEIW